jgi:hypothetical protein
MEAITRLVSESLARHGFDRPLDYRRLHWSRWFRCESTHSLLVVPSKPGVFALAEEIMDLPPGTTHGGADALVRPAERRSAEFLGGAALQRCDQIQEMKAASAAKAAPTNLANFVEERRFSAASSEQSTGALAPEATRRMLAVTQFFEDDDMAFVLDRMLIRERSRLASGRYFVRFVVIEDESQRRSICTALNQWIANQSSANSAERAGSIGSHFASSLELTPATEYVTSDAQANLFDEAHMGQTNVGRTLLSANAGAITSSKQVVTAASEMSPTAPHLDSGAAANIHCPSLFPAGF